MIGIGNLLISLARNCERDGFTAVDETVGWPSCFAFKAR